MADSERKRLVWDIKKTLLTLSVDELFQIAKAVGAVPGMDESRVNSEREVNSRRGRMRTQRPEA